MIVKEIVYMVEDETRIRVILINVSSDIINVIGSIMLVNNISENLKLNSVIVIRMRMHRVII